MEYLLFLRNAESDELTDGILIRDSMLPRVGDSYWLRGSEGFSKESQEEFRQGKWYKVAEVRRSLDITKTDGLLEGVVADDDIEVIIDEIINFL